MKSSIFGTLNLRDFVNGLVLVVITSVLDIIKTSVEAGSLNFDWKEIGRIALIASVGYLLKNLTTNSKGEVLTKETTKP